MKNSNVYLTFNGNCKDAMTFYKSVFGGELQIMPFEGNPGTENLSAEDKTRTMHSQLEAEGIMLMASDSFPGHPVTIGSNVTINMNFTDENEQTTVFNAISAGGHVIMPLEITFWGARFGMCSDKFGVNWMTNCEQKKG